MILEKNKDKAYSVPKLKKTWHAQEFMKERIEYRCWIIINEQNEIKEKYVIASYSPKINRWFYTKLDCPYLSSVTGPYVSGLINGYYYGRQGMHYRCKKEAVQVCRSLKNEFKEKKKKEDIKLFKKLKKKLGK